MRKLLFCAVIAAGLNGCARDATAPVTPQSTQADGNASVNSTLDPGMRPFGGLRGLGRLPDNLKLTADQQAAIKAAVSTLMQSKPADRKAAAAALKTRIEGILTPAQKAWLTANAPKPCTATAAPLSEAQKAQIKTLRDAFAAANKADLDAVHAAMRQARAAHQAGKTPAEIRTILESAKPARERLRTAEQKLRTDIEAILTPGQRAARAQCRPDGRGNGRMGAGRGGMGHPGGPGSIQGRFAPGGPRGYGRGALTST